MSDPEVLSKTENSWISWVIIFLTILYFIFILITHEQNKESHYVALIYLDSYVVPTMYEVGSTKAKLYQEAVAVTLTLKHFNGNIYNYSYGCPQAVNKCFLVSNDEIILQFRTGERSSGKIELDPNQIKNLENKDLFLLVNINGKTLKKELEYISFFI